MPSKAQKRAKARLKAPPQDNPQAPQEARYVPKAGPGQRFKREMIPVLAGGRAETPRYRNTQITPLQAAYERGQLAGPEEGKAAPAPGQIIANERFEYAEKFELYWYTLLASPSRDSTIPTISSGGTRSLSELQQIAGREIQRLRGRMAARNYLIVEAFCGNGNTMVEALRHAGVEAHPVGTAFRVREALDDLVCAMTGRLQVPLLVPGAKKGG